MPGPRSVAGWLLALALPVTGDCDCEVYHDNFCINTCLMLAATTQLGRGAYEGR